MLSGLIFLILSSLLLLKHPFFSKYKEFPGWWIFAVFIIKTLIGFALIWVYTHYYNPEGADIYKYFNEGMVISRCFFDHPLVFVKILLGIGHHNPEVNELLNNLSYWNKPIDDLLYNDSRILIKLNALLGVFSGNLYAHTIVMNLLSIAGLTALYRFFTSLFAFQSKLLFAAVFLIPSVLFWGSGMLKEGLHLFALGYTLLFVAKALSKKLKLKEILLSLFPLGLVIAMKPFVLVALLPSLTALVAGQWFKAPPLLRYLASSLVFFAFSLLLPFVHPLADFYQFISSKQHHFINLALDVEAGSFIDFPKLEPHLWSILKNSPLAVFNVWFRPFPLEASSLFMVAAALENILMSLLAILAGISAIRFKPRLLRSEGFWFCIVFSIILFAIIGLTTPVAGAFTRYRITALPFVAASMAFLLNPLLEKLKLIINKKV